MNILIIGGGNMGLTFAKAFINSHVVTPDQLVILEKDKEDKISRLKSLNIANIQTDFSCVQDADLIVLAVKPQDSITLFSQISKFVDESQVILSIMAGIKIQTMKDALNVTKIVRAMPNLPSQIGLGMTAFTSTESVTRFEQGAIQNLLATTGKTLNVENEDSIDAVTAISGSGPAYIYYFMNSMIKAASNMGFNNSESQMLVLQTFLGALSLFQQSGYSCEEWIKKVASKGGTTEAAITYFNSKNLNEVIVEGAEAALRRANELGK